MTVFAQRAEGRDGLGPAWAAVRVRLGLVVALFVLAAAGWWWMSDVMPGMDDGPWTSLGPVGWFLGVWVVMMAAMMLPSLAPTVALYSRRTRQRSPLYPLAFTVGYLLIWSAAGLSAFLVGHLTSSLAGNSLSWQSAGRPITAATLVVAGAYEVTPLKAVCLRRCHSPLGSLLGYWRDRWSGALRMGVRIGVWCLGCCWALMASLFALGVMSITWMALVAAIISAEKTVPWRRAAPCGAALLLCALAILVLVAPSWVPGLTLPHGAGGPPMGPMNS